MTTHLCLAAMLLAAFTASAAFAKVKLNAKDVKIIDQVTVDQTDKELKEAPGQIENLGRYRVGFVEKAHELAALWKAWRGGDPIKVDFTKHFVLVLTAEENAWVDWNLELVKEDLKISGRSTERVPQGMCFVMLVLERAVVKSINGKAVNLGK